MAQEPNLFPDPVEQPSFFSDLKVLISLLAFGISCVALAWSITNKAEQDRRWAALNAAALVLKEGKVQPVEKLSLGEANTRDWGYQPSVFKGDIPEETFLYSALRLRDAKSGKPIESARTVYTADEAIQEIIRLNLPPEEVVMARILTLSFTFQNIGRAPAQKVKLTAEMLDPVGKNGTWHQVYGEGDQPDIGPAQAFTAHFDVAVPVDAAPKALSFRWQAEFEDAGGKKRTSDMAATWDWNKNVWSYPLLKAEPRPD